jgi:hypothetical protein
MGLEEAAAEAAEANPSLSFCFHSADCPVACCVGLFDWPRLVLPGGNRRRKAMAKHHRASQQNQEKQAQ